MVQTTVASCREARHLAGLMVKARLAACVQIIPIHSTYRWHTKVEQAAEWLLLAKTQRARKKALMTFIRRHHSYEVPEIMALSVTQVLPAYRQWIFRETKKQPAARNGREPCPPR